MSLISSKRQILKGGVPVYREDMASYSWLGEGLHFFIRGVICNDLRK